MSSPDELTRRVGLCATCRSSRRITSAKGSDFWLCEAAKTVPGLSKYPQLPKRACPAYAGQG